MIQVKRIFKDDKEYIKIFSDEGFYIQDEQGILYSIVYKLPGSPSVYTESARKLNP